MFCTQKTILAIVLGFSMACFAQISLPADLTVKNLAQKGETAQENPELFSSSGIKSVRNAFLFSLLLPGAGELYAKSYVKSGVFFAAELACWGGFLYYNGKYNDQESGFRAYADSYWVRSVFTEWYDSMLTIEDTTELGIEILPETNTQQYYEMIGKYDWFALGWSDIISRDDYEMLKDSTYNIALSQNGSEVHKACVRLFQSVESEKRDKYMKMRADANSQYTTAKYFIGAIVVNHLVSAFDAAITTKKTNDKLYEGFSGVQSVRIEPYIALSKSGEPTPKLICTVTW